jgi:fumarate hydratase class II
MPGKVNPVMAEALIMVCAQVQGNDVAIGIGASWGNFELNAMLPLLAANLLDSIMYLGNAVEVFTEKLVRGLQANRARCEELVEQSLAMVTGLTPVIGYDRAAAVAQEAYRTGRTVREVLLAAGDVPREQIERLLNPWSMTKPGGGS